MGSVPVFLDETHDPDLRSWVESANAPGCDFPIQNLPFGIFRRKNSKEERRAGVAIGDQILRVVAEKLKFEMAADTLISRLGGDEFVVLCEDVNDALEARMIGQQLRRLLNRPIVLGEKSLDVGASIGVAVCPEDATTAEDLLKNADLALYHAKHNGRNRTVTYSQFRDERASRRVVGVGH